MKFEFNLVAYGQIWLLGSSYAVENATSPPVCIILYYYNNYTYDLGLRAAGAYLEFKRP